MIWRVCLPVLVLYLFASQAVASIVLVDEERFVATSVYLEVGPENASDADMREPMGFDYFERMIESGVELDGLESRATAVQVSTLSATGVDTQGSVTTGLDGTYDPERTGFAESESATDVTFMVEAASMFSIAGTLTGISQGFAQVQITGPSGVEYVNTAIGTSFEFEATGDLEPGQYRLVIRATAETRAGRVPRGLEDSIAAYSAVLTVSETTPIETARWSELKDLFRE
jgi:hypothetical protein